MVVERVTSFATASSTRGVGAGFTSGGSLRGSSSIFPIIGEYCVPRDAYLTCRGGGAGITIGDGEGTETLPEAVFKETRGDDAPAAY